MNLKVVLLFLLVLTLVECQETTTERMTSSEAATTLDGSAPVIVRLADGSFSREGRVEVLYNGQWGTVCKPNTGWAPDEGWSLDNADVICRMMGYPSASHGWSGGQFGQGSGPISLYNVKCRGDESNIDECQHRGWFITPGCSHADDAGVRCDSKIHLVNGSSSREGRVEVYYQGQWGTVCDDGWNLDDADVICRMLGYPSASHVWGDAHFGLGSGPILLDNVACCGNETSINECQHSGSSNHDCAHTKDAGVTCAPVLVRLVDGNSSSEGRVEVYYHGQWGTVCGYGWDFDDADVICRMLGYPSASNAFRNAHFGQGLGPIILDDVNCRGDEYSIDECQHLGWFITQSCSHANDAGVKCDLLRLVNGSSSDEGRVEFYYNGQWGTVCDDGWDLEDADVICRMLGYFSAAHAWGNTHFGQGSGPILLDNVNCGGNETSIHECQHSGWSNHHCTHTNDAGVTCAPVLARLVDGRFPSEGRVEVLYRGQWGTVCYDGWDLNDAKVICRMLGYPSASDVLHDRLFGQGSGPILNDFNCLGHESNIAECQHLGWFTHNCRHNWKAGIRCGFKVRLVNGNSAREGRVEVYYRSQWGTVCDDGWDLDDAAVICRMLGYPSALHAWGNAHFGQGSGPILLDNVDCGGNETSIDECQHSGWRSHGCAHTKDAGVTCAPVLVRLLDGRNPSEGRVEVRYHDQWGTICHQHWTLNDANVICRMLGYHSALHAWRTAYFSRISEPVILNDIGCLGNESSIDECQRLDWFVSWSCSDYDPAVTCEFVRLVNGSFSREGRVEFYYQGQWGTVCDDGWGIHDAHVICRMLGYPSASHAWGNAHFGQGSGPIHLNNIDCGGNETSIFDCQHSALSSHNCGHTKDAGVTCTPVLVRLVDGNSPEEGRVEILYQDRWATALRLQWSYDDSDVICRMLGYPSASVTWRSFNGQSFPNILDEVDCFGNESSIDECQHFGWRDWNDRWQGYGGSYFTWVDCGGSLTPIDSVRLVDGRYPREGRVEVYYQGQWGTVCDDGWGLDDAAVICRMLGYPSALHAWGNAHFGQGLGPILFDSVDCGGNETSIAECLHGDWFSHSCGHYQDSGVTCEPPVITCPANMTVDTEPSRNLATVILPDVLVSGLVTLAINLYGSPRDHSFDVGDEVTLSLAGSPHLFTYTVLDDAYDGTVCDLYITLIGHCASETVDRITWPVTSAGSLTESVQRCALTTTKAGAPLAVRKCIIVEPPVYFQWEEPQQSCGETRNDVTLEDVAEVDVSTGNVVEVAEFLASRTSETLPNDTRDVEIVSDILMTIVNAGSGNPEVTELVVATVNNVIRTGAEPAPDDTGSSSSAIVQSVETQVSLTLRQEGNVSIRQETIHVEAISFDPAPNSNGLSFASIRQPGQGSPQEGSLEGTQVETFEDNTTPSDIDLVASVHLPGSIVDLVPTSDGNSPSPLQVRFIIYAKDTLFQSASLRRYKEEANATRKLAGSVVSLTVENVKLVNLTEPLVVQFKKQKGATSEECVFWDFELEDGVGDWSPVGCTHAGTTNQVVSCHCNHATNFAVLVDVQGQQTEDTPYKRALDILSQVGCALSITALVITLIICLAIRKLQIGISRRIVIHFCVSLLLLYIIFLAGVENARGSGGGCVFVAALLHYLTLCSMVWMAVEARNMYVSTVEVFPENTPRYMLKACLVAWGSPLIVLTVTLAAAVSHYNNKDYCFLKPDLVLYVGLIAPIGLILIHNIITFILVMRSLPKVREESQSQQISKRLQNAVGISALMGLTWVFGFLAINKATFAYQLIFCIANSLQGAVIFVMFCVRREEFRDAVALYLSRVRFCRKPTPSSHNQSFYLPAVPQTATSPSSDQTAEMDHSVARV